MKKKVERPLRRTLLIVSILFSLLSPVCIFAADRIVLCRAGQTDDTMWNDAKKYFTGKGFSIDTYDAPRSIEKQIETANKINREKARFMLVLEIVTSDRSDVFVAMSDAKKPGDLIMNADEVPGAHATRSEELGSSIAAHFQRKVKSAPLFMFLGIDMPAVFVRLNVTKDGSAEAFDKLYDGVLNFTKRGSKDEREFKGGRRNPATED